VISCPSVAERSLAATAPQDSTDFFTSGSQSASNYADFDASYQPINGLDVQDTALTRTFGC
jgi:hypothetical protein